MGSLARRVGRGGRRGPRDRRGPSPATGDPGSALAAQHGATLQRGVANRQTATRLRARCSSAAADRGGLRSRCADLRKQTTQASMRSRQGAVPAMTTTHAGGGCGCNGTSPPPRSLHRLALPTQPSLFGRRTASSGPPATPEERRVVACGVCLCSSWFTGHR